MTETTFSIEITLDSENMNEVEALTADYIRSSDDLRLRKQSRLEMDGLSGLDFALYFLISVAGPLTATAIQRRLDELLSGRKEVKSIIVEDETDNDEENAD